VFGPDFFGKRFDNIDLLLIGYFNNHTSILPYPVSLQSKNAVRCGKESSSRRRKKRGIDLK
jgi:hypothetical protein